MRTSIKFGTALLALAAGAAPAAGEPTKRGSKPRLLWARSYSDAVQEATERNLPIFLHSHAATCPPCHSIRKAVFENDDYVAWANASTVHLLSYYIAPEDEDAEPKHEVERDGEKALALTNYPDFTAIDMELLIRGIDARLQFPEKTPWAGVIAPDGLTILAPKPGGASAKEFRSLYEAEAKKLGPSLPRKDWLRARHLLTTAAEAEVDERWKDVVVAVKDLHAASGAYPAALRTRVRGHVEAAAAVRARLVEAAERAPAAERAKALARIEADFAGLPTLEPEASPGTAEKGS